MLPSNIVQRLIRNVESGRPSQYDRRIRHALNRARRFVPNIPNVPEVKHVSSDVPNG